MSRSCAGRSLWSVSNFGALSTLPKVIEHALAMSSDTPMALVVGSAGRGGAAVVRVVWATGGSTGGLTTGLSAQPAAATTTTDMQNIARTRQRAPMDTSVVFPPLTQETCQRVTAESAPPNADRVTSPPRALGEKLSRCGVVTL